MKLKRKLLTTPEFNNLTAENFATRLAQANLASKNDISALVKKKCFNDKLKNLNKNVTSNKTKHVLVKNDLNQKKVKAISTKGLTKDLIILNQTKYFSSGIFQNYLVFMPAEKCIEYFSGTTPIDSWKSK